MKKSFVLFSLISLISLSSVVYAMTLGVIPPENYIKNLKSCTKGVAVNNSTVYETYTVKGLLPDGRCEVQIVSYTNFANKKVYDEFKSLYSSFYKDGKVPSQAEMIEKGKQDKDIMTCKFTKEQRDALYKNLQEEIFLLVYTYPEIPEAWILDHAAPYMPHTYKMVYHYYNFSNNHRLRSQTDPWNELRH